MVTCNVRRHEAIVTWYDARTDDEMRMRPAEGDARIKEDEACASNDKERLRAALLNPADGLKITDS